MSADPPSNQTLNHQAEGMPQIPGYRLFRELGRGGMGVVYLAYQVSLQREVALKLLLASVANPSAGERLRREAIVAGSLGHPNICAVHDLGEHEGQPYVVMELVRGRTLQAFIAENPTPAQRLAVLAQLAAALAAAHRAGVVHRDVKPSNAMVSPEGQVKTLDFGLAQLFSSDARLTSPGAGTPRYMAPEQALGEAVSPAADVFALGVLTYEMLTGKLPFPGYAWQLLESPTPLEPPAHPSIGPLLAALLRRMLHGMPQERPDADEVARLFNCLAREPAPTITPGPVGSVTVGRQRERNHLTGAATVARAGRGQFVGLAGEAGLGKTTLAEEFLAGIDVSGCAVARGRCSERLAGTEPYLPFIEVLDDLARWPTRESFATLLARCAPTWAGLLTHADHPVRMPADQTGTPAHRLQREMVALLRELGHECPLVLLLDDLQWADCSTVDLLSYLVPRMRDSRLLVVLTYRPSDLARQRHPFQTLLRELRARGELSELTLGFLGREQVGNLLDATFPDHHFPPDLAGLLHTRSEGNPLFVSALIRYLRDHAVLSEAGGVWALTRAPGEVQRDLPDTVRGLVERKLERLEEADREILRAASVQGVECDSIVLARALNRDQFEVEDRLAALAREHAFVCEDSEREFPNGQLSLRYRFVHVLYQNAIYETLTSTRRARLCKVVAEALLSVVGEQGTGALAELALLFREARDWPRAVRFCLRAAQASARVHGFQEALLLAETGLQALGSLSAGVDRDRCEIELQELRALGAAAAQGIAAPAVKGACERGLELSSQLDEGGRAVSLLSGLYLYHLTRGETRRAIQLGEEILCRAEQAGEQPGRRDGCFMIGAANFYRGDYLQATDFLERAVTFDDGGVGRSTIALHVLTPLVGCRAYAAMARWYLGQFDRSRIHLRHLFEMGQQPNLSISVRVFLSVTAGLIAVAENNADALLRHAEATLEVAVGHRLAQWRAWGTIQRGLAWAMQGKVDCGIREMTAGITAYRDTSSVASLPWYLLVLAEVLGKAGRAEEALPLLDEAWALQQGGLGHRQMETLRIRGDLLATMNAPDELVERCYRQSLELSRANHAKFFELKAARCLSRFAREHGRRDEGRRLLLDVLAGFTEGCDVAEVIDANRELTEL